MGFRFQRRISILPGVRINLSKSGISTSIGPKGADVNIGPRGISANAGIPGTGLSYRTRLGAHSARDADADADSPDTASPHGRPQKTGIHGRWFGVVLLVGALAFWAGRHVDRPASETPATAAISQAQTTSAAPQPVRMTPQERIAAMQPGTVYVRRGGSVVRESAKPSGKVLKHEAKGATITLLEKTDTGWAKIQDGNTIGWMRASVLGQTPPP